jgi:hypothetical protein
LHPSIGAGDRSAIAANLLAQAGFKHAYNIIDGMEGDAVDDPASPFLNQRRKNGWKNSGSPWTYDLTPERMSLPKPRKPRNPFGTLRPSSDGDVSLSAII